MNQFEMDCNTRWFSV